jgi:phosphatidylinositol alpha-mannosyltransferase
VSVAGRMNIAVFSYGLPVVGEKRGGIERVAHVLAQELARRGHNVEVWTHDPKPSGAAYEVRMLPWKRFASSWMGRRLTMGYLGNVLALLPRYEAADVVVAIGDSLLLPLKGKPLVRVMAGSALGETLHADSPWRFLMQAGVYVQELLTALTQPACVGISQNTRRYNPFVRRVIPLGVDTSAFFPSPSEKTEEPSVLFVGAVEGRKRGRELVGWFTQHVRARHPSATLAMVSRPGPRAEGVTYHTGVSDSELAAMYRRAWVYASPSTYEGFGLPYLEALASGTPVVATPNPGSREVLCEGRYGRLVEDREFGAALAELLSDAGARETLAARGLERARELSLAAMVDGYESLLAELCRTDAKARGALNSKRAGL